MENGRGPFFISREVCVFAKSLGERKRRENHLHMQNDRGKQRGTEYRGESLRQRKEETIVCFGDFHVQEMYTVQLCCKSVFQAGLQEPKKTQRESRVHRTKMEKKYLLRLSIREQISWSSNPLA